MGNFPKKTLEFYEGPTTIIRLSDGDTYYVPEGIDGVLSEETLLEGFYPRDSVVSVEYGVRCLLARIVVPLYTVGEWDRYESREAAEEYLRRLESGG